MKNIILIAGLSLLIKSYLFTQETVLSIYKDASQWAEQRGINK